MKRERKSREVDVFKTLYDARDAITIYRIAKNSNMHFSTTHYAVQRLVDKGVVIKLSDGRRNLYGLQPVFFDKHFWDLIIKQYRGLIKTIIKKVEEKKFNNSEIDILYMLKVVFDSLLTE